MAIFGSGTHLNSAIKKHGLENFQKDILFEYDNADEMIAKERELVDRKFIARKDVYNLTLGGCGWATLDSVVVRTPEKNCILIHKTDERWLSRELKSVASDHVLTKDSLGNTFRVSVTDPRLLNGDLVYFWTGRNHTEETKKIMSEKAKIHSKGERNSSFGTCWIHRVDIKENKKIQKELFDSFLSEGWIKGRKIKF